MEQSWLNGIYGGVLIGLAAASLLMLYGRVLGVSGIVGRIFEFGKSDTLWRVMFFAGTAAGGALAARLWPENFSGLLSEQDYGKLLLAGMIVGFGTKMGNGCTSGHGVCGIGRLSPRGLVATCMFIFCGMITVTLLGR